MDGKQSISVLLNYYWLLKFEVNYDYTNKYIFLFCRIEKITARFELVKFERVAKMAKMKPFVVRFDR